jgi:hypothetical protein
MDKPSNWFDRIISLLTLIVTAVVGGLAWKIASTQAGAESAHAQFAAINDMFQKCTSGNMSDTQYFSTFYSAIKHGDIDMAAIAPDLAKGEFQKVLNYCWTLKNAREAQSPPPSSASPDRPEGASAADALPGKFIYLGTYVGGKWVTHYFDDYQMFDPTSNAGENTRDISIGRDTQINVRHGVLNASTTDYPKLLCTVSGTHIKIAKEFQWWADSNNYWARIADDPQSPPVCSGKQ